MLRLPSSEKSSTSSSQNSTLQLSPIDSKLQTLKSRTASPSATWKSLFKSSTAACLLLTSPWASFQTWSPSSWLVCKPKTGRIDLTVTRAQSGSPSTKFTLITLFKTGLMLVDISCCLLWASSTLRHPQYPQVLQRSD